MAFDQKIEITVFARKTQTMPLDLLVIYGSVRGDRQGIRAAKFILEACRARGHTATLIDPAG